MIATLWSNPDFQLVFWTLIKVGVVINGLLVVVSYLIYAERKICGRIQGRFGPTGSARSGCSSPGRT